MSLDREPLSSPDDSSLAVLLSDDVARPRSARAAIAPAVRAGFTDLRRSKFLAVSTAVTSLIAALAVMSGPVFHQLVSAGEATVMRGSEVIVFVEGSVSGSELTRVVGAISRLRGVDTVEASSRDDLAALPPRIRFISEQSHAYTLHPTGRVPLEGIQGQLRGIPEVRNAEMALGYLSIAAIRLTADLVPWLAGVAVAFGLVMLGTLAIMVGRIRAEEAGAMSLVGGDPLITWLSFACVVLVPSFAVVLTVGSAVVVGAPWFASLLFASEAAAQVSPGGLIPTAIFLALGSLLAATGFSYLGIRARL